MSFPVVKSPPSALPSPVIKCAFLRNYLNISTIISCEHQSTVGSLMRSLPFDVPLHLR